MILKIGNSQMILKIETISIIQIEY